jgi:hypothetical protein
MLSFFCSFWNVHRRKWKARLLWRWPVIWRLCGYENTSKFYNLNIDIISFCFIGMECLPYPMLSQLAVSLRHSRGSEDKHSLLLNRIPRVRNLRPTIGAEFCVFTPRNRAPNGICARQISICAGLMEKNSCKKKSSLMQGLNPWIPRDRRVFNPLSHRDLLIASSSVALVRNDRHGKPTIT